MKLSHSHRTKVTALSATALVTGLVMLSPEVAQASNQFVDQIARQLARAVVILNGNYRMTHEPQIGTLSDRGKHMITLNLRSGINYGLIGVCDSDCADVDLKLYDENYGLIDTDTRSNDTPVVTVTPYWTGRFYLEVDMESCQANYCYYGVGIFGR